MTSRGQCPFHFFGGRMTSWSHADNVRGGGGACECLHPPPSFKNPGSAPDIAVNDVRPGCACAGPRRPDPEVLQVPVSPARTWTFGLP